MLAGYKTYITGVLAILTAVATYLTGDATLAQAGELTLTALMGMFIRAGIKSDTTTK